MSGISLAAMAFVKIQFGFLLIFILLLGERRVFLIAFFCWIALFFAGLPELGFEHYHQYFFALQNHTSKAAYDLHNISFNGQWHRLLGNDKYQATIMYLTTSLILFISVLVWSYRHKQKASIEIPIFIGLAMIPMLSPNTEPHHLLVALPALIFVAFHIERLTFKAKFLYMVSAVMIVSRYSWSRFALTSSVWLSPLLSLKIIGVFCLLIVLIYLGAAKVKPSNSPCYL